MDRTPQVAALGNGKWGRGGFLATDDAGKTGCSDHDGKAVVSRATLDQIRVFVEGANPAVPTGAADSPSATTKGARGPDAGRTHEALRFPGC